MIRYRTDRIPSPWKPADVIAVEDPIIDYGDSISDFTQFRPDSSIVRASGASGVGSEAYLYPDGIDTGADMPVAFKKGADLAEISIAVRQGQEEVQYNISQIREEAQKVVSRHERRVRDSPSSQSPSNGDA